MLTQARTPLSGERATTTHWSNNQHRSVFSLTKRVRGNKSMSLEEKLEAKLNLP